MSASWSRTKCCWIFLLQTLVIIRQPIILLPMIELQVYATKYWNILGMLCLILKGRDKNQQPKAKKPIINRQLGII